MATDNSQLIEQRLPNNTAGLIYPEDVRVVAHALDQQVPNQRRGGPFFVTFLTQAQAVADGRAGDGSLESLDAGLLCLGARARVELHPDGNGIDMVLVFDGTGAGPQVAVNGNFQRTIAGKWVKADSLEAVNANVPYYSPVFNAPAGYPVAYLVRYQVPGQAEAFYYSRKAGHLPAPSGAPGDLAWRVVPGPVAATVRWQAVSLLAAQGLAGAGVEAGLLYAITGAPTPNVPNPNDSCWNGSGATETVYVQGFDQEFDLEGVLLDANGVPAQRVRVSVATGSYQALTSASTFADLQGDPSDNGPLSAALARKAGIYQNQSYYGYNTFANGAKVYVYDSNYQVPLILQNGATGGGVQVGLDMLDAFSQGRGGLRYWGPAWTRPEDRNMTALVGSGDETVGIYANANGGKPADIVFKNTSGNSVSGIIKGDTRFWGIGTATPAYLVDVNGTINAKKILVNGVELTSSGQSTPSNTSTGIDYANPILLQASATLVANKAYYLQQDANGNAYPVTLPDASKNLGAGIFLQVDKAATGLYPVASGDGLAMYATETMLYRATLGGWTRQASGLHAMEARLETDLNQQDFVPGNQYYIIPLSQPVQQLAAVPGLVSTGTNSIVVQRKCSANVLGVIALKSMNTAGRWLLGIRLTKADGSVSYPVQLTGAVGNGNIQVSIPLAQNFTPGDTLQLYTYLISTDANLTGQYPGSQCSLHFFEIV